MKEPKDFPKEIFIEQEHINKGWCQALTSREEVAASHRHRLSQNWSAKPEAELTQNVYVYKFSHIEIIKEKTEITIEKP